MTSPDLTALLAWASGPTVGIAISSFLEGFRPFHDWKPEVLLGFDPKRVVSMAVSGLIGFAAYEVALNVPAATIDALNPYVSAAFPLITMIVVLAWHLYTKNQADKTTITATTTGTGTGTATWTSTPAPTTTS